LRTTVSHGLNILGVTNMPNAPNADFTSVLAQAQYSAQITDTLQLYSRLVGQLSSQSLYSFEQVAIGGPSTVRGYVQNALLSDSAIIGSLEVREAVAHWAIPGLSTGDRDGTIELCPFVDGGRGWNQSGPTPPPAGIASVGVGLQWTLRAGLAARIDYGYALIHPQGVPDLLQPLSFNIVAQF
jgi:hemolysin activation/secretion protein